MPVAYLRVQEVPALALLAVEPTNLARSSFRQCNWPDVIDRTCKDNSATFVSLGALVGLGQVQQQQELVAFQEP